MLEMFHINARNSRCGSSRRRIRKRRRGRGRGRGRGRRLIQHINTYTYSNCVKSLKMSSTNPINEPLLKRLKNNKTLGCYCGFDTRLELLQTVLPIVLSFVWASFA